MEKLCLFILLLPLTLTAGHHKLLLLLLDGLRHDYVTKMASLPGFQAMANSGIVAKFVRPSFPTLNYPSYYTLMTGLHPGSHGILDDVMFDEEKNATFKENSMEFFEPRWWNKGEPIWVTARKQNQRFIMYYWPGCNVEIRGHRPSHCALEPIYARGYPNIADLRTALDRTINHFEDDSVGMSAIFYGELRRIAERQGPDSSCILDELHQLDRQLMHLIKNIKRKNLLSEVNVIVTGSHGVASVTQSNLLPVDELLQGSSHLVDKIVGEGAIVNLLPVENKTDEVLEHLKKTLPSNRITLYSSSSLPSRWHYDGPTVQPIILTAKEGWYLVQSRDLAPTLTPELSVDLESEDIVEPLPRRGASGYDNRVSSMMHGFIAFGPDFQKGATVDAFDSVDLYNLMCHVTGLTSSPNNGTWDHVKGFLFNHSHKTSVDSCLNLALLFICFRLLSPLNIQ